MKQPWYPWFARDFNADEPVLLMTLEEEGAYRRLLDHQWLHGSIPDDVKALGVICKNTPPARMQKLWAAIAGCFTASDHGRLVNARLERVREKQEKRATKARENGTKGGRPKNPTETQPVIETEPKGEPNRKLPETETETETDTTADAVVGAAAPRGWDAFWGDVPEDYRDAVRNALRASPSSNALRQTLVAMTQGMGQPGDQVFTPAVVGQALHDMAVAGAKVTPMAISGFARRLVRDERSETPGRTFYDAA